MQTTRTLLVLALLVSGVGCDGSGPDAAPESALPTQVEAPAPVTSRVSPAPTAAGPALRQTRANPVGWVGQKHNEGLHFILHGIPAEVRRSRSVTGYYNAAYGRCVSYMAGEGYPAAACDRLKWRGRATALGVTSAPWRFASRSAAAAAAPAPSGATTELERVLGEIEHASSTYGTLADLADALSGIEGSARIVLVPEEMEAVFAVSSVAYSSADYWENHGDAWLRDNGGEELLLMRRRAPLRGWSPVRLALAVTPLRNELAARRWSHRRVVAADVRGAIAGALGGLAAGGQVLQGAVIGSIVVSADEALAQLFELLS